MRAPTSGPCARCRRTRGSRRATVPQLDGGIDPRRLAAQRVEARRRRAARPSTSTVPDAGRCQPSSSPTSVDLPAPDGPTIATCAPGAIASVTSSRIVWPPARTVTSRSSIRTPAARRRRRRNPSAPRSPASALFLERPERLEQPQRQVALRRVLPARSARSPDRASGCSSAQYARSSAPPPSSPSRARANSSQAASPKPGDELRAARRDRGAEQRRARAAPTRRAGLPARAPARARRRARAPGRGRGTRRGRNASSAPVCVR